MSESTIASPSKVRDSYIPFNATLRFDVIVHSSTKLNQNQLSKLKVEIKREAHHTFEKNVDLFKEVGSDTTKLYIFDTEKYPVEIEKLWESRKKLQHDLFIASRKHGIKIKSTSLHAWGGQNPPSHYKKFEIQCSRKYKHESKKYKLEKEKRIADNKFKLSTLNGSRKLHSVPAGNKQLCRKSKTGFDEDRRCQCSSYLIFNNSNCFFMVAPETQGQHTFHGQDFSFAGSSILPETIESSRRVMSFATASASSQAKGVFSMHGHASTKQAIANASRKDKSAVPNGDISGSDLSSIDDADGVRDLLLQYNAKVLVLKLKADNDENPDKAQTNDTPATVVENEVTTFNKDNLFKETIQGKLGNEDSKMTNSSAVDWLTTEKKVPDSSVRENLLCVAWMTTDMAKLIKAYPNCLSIDATHKTVKIDGLTLLTVTTKDSFGKTIVVLRIWIPNQTKWMFRYVLFTVIPSMIGKEYCLKLQSFCTDGDEHLCSIIDEAIRFIYISGKRYGGPCIDEQSVYMKYLSELVLPFNHNQVSKCHWAIYAYLMAAHEASLTPFEKVQLKLYQKLDFSKRKGTPCKLIKEGTNLLSAISKDADLTTEDGKTALYWSTKSAADRLTNYSSEYAKRAVQEYENKLQGLNNSLYEVHMSQSQGDGWEKFGPANDFESNDDLLEPIQEMEDDCPFEGKLDSAEAAIVGNDRKASEQSIMKQMYELFSKYDFSNPTLRNIVQDKMTESKELLRDLHESDNGPNVDADDGKVRFANTSIGDNRRDRITKR